MAQQEFKWLDRNEYPFSSKYYEVNDHKLHFIEEGKGESIVFVHGTPSWSFDYRKLILDLRSDYRCIAIDHIGFGLSDKPKEYDYSTLNHSKTLESFILDKDLKDITLVVHDFGGPIALNFAIQHPERVKNLIILNSWLWSSEKDPDYIKLKRILKSPILPFLYRNLNFSPRVILPKSFGDQKLSRQLRKQYTKPFANRNQRNGALAFARSLLHDQQWFESLWESKQAIEDKACLFIWGMKDEIVKPHHLKKFQSGFNKSTTVELESSGHFPQEEQAEEVIQAIRSFLKSN